MTHFIEVYSCGHIASQCRCPAETKVRKTLVAPCPACLKARQQAQGQPS